MGITFSHTNMSTEEPFYYFDFGTLLSQQNEYYLPIKSILGSLCESSLPWDQAVQLTALGESMISGSKMSTTSSQSSRSYLNQR